MPHTAENRNIIQTPYGLVKNDAAYKQYLAEKEAKKRAQLYEWRSEADGCDECTQYDGQMFTLDNAPIMHPNCKCRLVANIDGEQVSVSVGELSKQKYEEQNNQKIINGNNLNAEERINALKTGKKIFINLADNQNATINRKWQHSPTLGIIYVNKYTPLIEKYSQQYNLDADVAKAILYSEASDFHDFGANMLADYAKASTSVWPMNIQGKTWGNFQGKQYDVYNPEQNIELGIRVLKSLYDAVPDKDIAKVATLWNQTGASQVTDYGRRAKEYYNNKYWDTSGMIPNLDND